MIRTKHLICFLFLVAGISGCKKNSVGKFDEGEIHYKISYSKNFGTLPMDLMPGTMIVKFKDNKSIMEIMAPIGNNGIFNIVDQDSETVFTYLSFLGIKYYYMGSTDFMFPGVDPMDGILFEQTGGIEEINGLSCKHLIAKIPGTDIKQDVWYTNEIDIDNPNISTPYSEIDGVLLKFFYRMGDMTVSFEADGIFNHEIADKDFEKTGKFVRISRDDMHAIITKMMSL